MSPHGDSAPVSSGARLVTVGRPGKKARTIFGERMNAALKLSPDFGTKAELLKALEMDRMTLYRYEVGPNVPPSDLVHHLAELLDVSADYLLGLSDEPTPSDTSGPSPALMRFLETRVGKTATPDEIAMLESLAARGGRFTVDTYAHTLTVLRTTMESDEQRAAETEAKDLDLIPQR